MTNVQNIGRKRKKNGFTQISNIMLEDNRLSWKAKGLLAYMLSRPNNWKITKTDLYNRATEGRDAMQKGLNELKECGYLHTYPHYKDGQLNGWIWEYDDAPFTPEEREFSTTENPHKTGENVLEFSTTENQYDRISARQDSSTYNNTKANNTNLNNTKAKEKKNKSADSLQFEEEFGRFWKLYPRKTKRVDALNSFIKARKVKKIPYETIESGLYKYLDYLEAQNTEEQFITHGSTWLNQRRWEDQFGTTIKKKPKNALDYMKQKYGENGGNDYESYGNGEIIDYYPTVLPESFQGF